MFVRKMLARALPLTALGLAAWCPAYAVEEPVKADGCRTGGISQHSHSYLKS